MEPAKVAASPNAISTVSWISPAGSMYSPQKRERDQYRFVDLSGRVYVLPAKEEHQTTEGNYGSNKQLYQSFFHRLF